MRTLRPLEPSEASSIDPSWSAPSGGDQHITSLWEGPVLLGAARIAPVRRARRAHVGDVSVWAERAEHATELLRAVATFADAWTTLDRLSLAVPAGDVAADAAPDAGFALEVCRRDRIDTGRDALSFARLRPGFTPRPPGPPPPWPSRHRHRPATVAIRLATEADSVAIRDLSTAPSAVWGTLQTPWSNERYYADRFRGTPPGNDVYVILADGQIAGTAGLHPSAIPDVLSLGMVVSEDWQGCGLGGRLLDHLITRAQQRDARRLELGVWEDNTRAQALYTSRGFQPEGTLRWDGIRAGGHASSLEMALLL